MAGQGGLKPVRGLPDVYKVEIRGIAIEGLEGAEQLEGDYFLVRTRHPLRLYRCEVEVTEGGAYKSLQLTIWRNNVGSHDLRVTLVSDEDRPSWFLSGITELTGPLEPEFDAASSKKQGWPQTIKVTPLPGAELSDLTRPQRAGGLAGMPAADGACYTCDCACCADHVPAWWNVEIHNMKDCYCDCSPVNDTYKVEVYSEEGCDYRFTGWRFRVLHFLRLDY